MTGGASGAAPAAALLALRWTAISSRNHAFHFSCLARISCTALDGFTYCSENTSAPQQQRGLYPTGSPTLGLTSSLLGHHLQHYRSLSSNASAKESNGNAESAADFTEVKPFTQTDNREVHADGIDDDLLSEAESSSDKESAKENPLGLGYAELDEDEKGELGKSPEVKKLYKALIFAPTGSSVSSILDKFMEGGRTINRIDISLAMLQLRKRYLYLKALQLAEWVEAKKCMDLLEKDYASRVDLIAKVQGLAKAEKYIKAIPKEFQTEAVYSTFLGNCVLARKLNKAEEVFRKMRDLGLPLTAFACNQLLILYFWLNKRKIADVLALMESENIRPTLPTYKVLIDMKGYRKDIIGVEQTIEQMKASGVKPDLDLQARIARYYISAAHKEKAECLVREMEGTGIEENRAACRFVLPLYASLDKEEDVARVWSACKENPSRKECVAGIQAWGELSHLDKAEEAFEIMHKTCKRLSANYYNALLNVYALSNNLTKGKELLRRMSTDGCEMKPATWHIIVKMYLAAGEVEKADSVLQKLTEKSSQKPLYSSYLLILENYSKRGDTDNAEKMFEKMRMAGYSGWVGMYQSLLEAYVVAKAPAYGFRERLKADDVFPGKILTGQLKTVDLCKIKR